MDKPFFTKEEKQLLFKGYSARGVPNRNEKCLCGSLDKFKHCCGSSWRKVESREGYRDLASQGDYGQAIVRLRAHITWYRICHAKHTIPLLAAGADRAEDLLRIDIEALFELCSRLLRYYGEDKRDSELHSLASSFENCVSDQRWIEKSIILKVLAALGKDWDEERAIPELKKYGSMAQYEDPELLMIALDVLGEELTFSKSYELAQRIVTLSEEPIHKLHYSVVSAALLLKACDKTGARDLLIERIHAFDQLSASMQDASSYELTQVAHAMDLAFTLTGDDIYAERGIKCCDELIANGELNSQGLSSAYRLRGELLRKSRQLRDAVQSFRMSHALCSDFVAVIFEAECEAIDGDLGRACALLKTVDESTLDDAGRADYAFVIARCALATKGEGISAEAKVALEALSLKDPFFEIERKDLLHKLELSSIRSQDAGNLVRAPYKGMLGWFSRYAELKPNAFGIGLNMNAMLDDLADKRVKKNSG